MDIFNGRRNPLFARILLATGGLFGLHRLYLGQPLEAFAYFSTFGVFCLGAFLDAFSIHSLVQQCNSGRINNAVAKQTKQWSDRVAPCSVSRFLAELLFGCWLGCVYGLAACFVIGVGQTIILSAVIALAISEGVYVIGNCGNQRRSFLYIWIGAFTAAFTCIQLLSLPIIRAILLSSLCATFLGNRSSRFASAVKRKYTYKAYFILCGVYVVAVVIVCVGVSQHILNRRISVVSQGSHSRITSSLGSLIMDRYFRESHMKQFFTPKARIEYLPVNAGSKSEQYKNAKTTNWNFPNSNAVESLAVFSSVQSAWVDYLVVFTCDYLRVEALTSRTSHVEFGPFSWALWRMLAIQVMGSSPFLSDEILLKNCADFLQKHQGQDKMDGPPHNNNFLSWRYLSVKKACELVAVVHHF